MNTAETYLAAALTAPVYAANCLVIGAGQDCVVVDPGAGVAMGVLDAVEQVGLRPRAVLATHGHPDHTWDAGYLCARWDVPFVVHEADSYRIDDPFASVEAGAGFERPGSFGDALAAIGIGPQDYRAPRRVETISCHGTVAQRFAFGDVVLGAVHAPGHTQGSTLWFVGEPAGGAILTGDVLFRGSVGRVDLPGGQPGAMARTLRELAALDDAWRIVPGHGPASTLGRERVTNPFFAR